MPKPQLGVVVPTLNSAATLEWTLCSLRAQRSVTLRILVADSGSTDDTLNICRSWRIDTIYVPPGNMYRAINEGLRQMDTEWVTYLNSDDLVYPQSYARLVQAGEQEGAAVAYGDCDFVDYEGRFLHTVKSSAPSRLRGMFLRGRLGFQQAAAVFGKSVFDEMRGFDERYRLIADYEFFCRLTFSGCKLTYVQRPAIAAFRVHDSQLSRAQSAAMEAELASFQRTIQPKRPFKGVLDVLHWRFQNSPIYLWRLMKQRP
jgi:glycosyltransferase involved in cell wall biosynthesis